LYLITDTCFGSYFGFIVGYFNNMRVINESARGWSKILTETSSSY
jgi:hypothetical protein